MEWMLIEHQKVSSVNKPEANRLRCRLRNHSGTCVQADLEKCKIFDWKKGSDNRQLEDVCRGGKGSHRAVGPDEEKEDVSRIVFSIC